jgi:outer membrane protein
MKAGTLTSRIALALTCLLATASAQADNLLSVWRAAQARDPAYLAARQTMQLAQQRATHAQLQLARERLELAEQELTLRATRLYFNALVARQGAELALAQLNAMAQQLRLAQRSVEAGLARESDLRDARERFDAARAQRVAAVRELEHRRAELDKLTGHKAESLEGLRADAPLWAPEPADPGFWVGRASESNLRVRVYKAALEASADEVARARNGDAPSVDITASRARVFNDGALNTPSEQVIRSRSAQLGLVLTLPIADGATDSHLREALAAQDRNEAGLAAARGEAVAQAQQALANVSQGLARVNALAEAARAGRGAFDSVQAGFKAGARFRAEASAAVQHFYAAERDWFKARVDALLQGLQLKAAAGTLDERDIARVNSLLAAAPAAGK